MKRSGNFDKKDKREHFCQAIENHVNAKEAYKTFQNGFKSIHTSAHFAIGPFSAVKEGEALLLY